MRASAPSDQFKLESLEPRILLSVAPVAAAGAPVSSESIHDSAIEVTLDRAIGSEDLLNPTNLSDTSSNQDVFSGMDGEWLTSSSSELPSTGTDSLPGSAEPLAVQTDVASPAKTALEPSALPQPEPPHGQAISGEAQTLPTPVVDDSARLMDASNPELTGAGRGENAPVVTVAAEQTLSTAATSGSVAAPAELTGAAAGLPISDSAVETLTETLRSANGPPSQGIAD